MKGKKMSTQMTARQKEIFKAIREGKAFISTFLGEMKVTGWQPTTGWVITGKGMSRRSFMATESEIKTK